MYELNPVAANAQASVAVPEGLDLDMWFVPPPREPTAQAEYEGGGGEKKKSKKGKGKDVESSVAKKKKFKQGSERVVLTPTVDETFETTEEIAQREKVLSV